MTVHQRDEERRRRAREASARYRAKHRDKVRAKDAAWREANPGYHRTWHAEVGRWRAAHRKYGITREWYEATLTAQGGGCGICGAPANPDGRLLAVDHDHDTGEPRGVLCNNCNRALGWFADDVDRLMAAAAYLLARTNVLGKVG